jgi:glutamate dehydrogenase (NAD(P)+)
VYSGLEETMIDSYRQVRAILDEIPGVPDLRTAAFIVAIRKIAEGYKSLGIWP